MSSRKAEGPGCLGQKDTHASITKDDVGGVTLVETITIHNRRVSAFDGRRWIVSVSLPPTSFKAEGLQCVMCITSLKHLNALANP